nr:S46 family peptidase [uncultured Holophaga sp.]
MRFRPLLPILTLLLSTGAIRAEEGMWTFENLPLKALQTRYGFAPDATWLGRLQQATLRFPGGTGSFVSPDGLVITNHHVGRGAIQQVSSAASDFIRDGFTAQDRTHELKVPGLELMMLVSTEEVTTRVNGEVKPGMSAAEALKARRAALSSLRQAEETRTGLTCEPVTLYQGGEYWLYRYRKFRDVRLVAAPEAGVASFGGDADNYTYPRWNLDFALFRVYEEGHPYHPAGFLPFSNTPLKAGDLTFIAGHPGTTYRGQTWAQMAFARDTAIPFQLAALGRQRSAIEAYAQTSPEATRTSADALSGIANQSKRLEGQLRGLLRPGALEGVAQMETELRRSLEARPDLRETSASWERIREAVSAEKEQLGTYTCISPRSCTLLDHALTLVRIHAEEALPSPERLPAYADGSLKATRERLLNPRPLSPGLDEARLGWMLAEARDLLGPEHPFVKAALAGRPPAVAARAAFAGTRLQDPAYRRQLLVGGAAAVQTSGDSLLALARILDPFQREVQKRWEAEVQGVLAEHGGRIARARFALQGHARYPDATFTLRLSYGTVGTYPTGSGTLAQPFTTFLGLYDRHAGWGGQGDWALPPRWQGARSSLDLTTPYNFIYSCDTVGGNSGSPVVNRSGAFVGINFDSVFEGQGGYYVYDSETKRAVAVDARAILASLRQVMGGAWIASELRER